MKTRFFTLITVALFFVFVAGCDDDDDSNNTNNVNNVNNTTTTNNVNNTTTTNNVNNTTNPVCGNAVIEGEETCDGTDVGTATCVALGYEGGDLGCSDTCDALVSDACTVGDGSAGSSCHIADDCSIGDLTSECYESFTTILGTLVLPGGYCTAACDVEAADPGCGDGSECFANSQMGVDGMCLMICTDVSECRTGYDCQALTGTTKYCLPPFGK